MAEKEFWDGFERELRPDLDITHSFPLRKKTVIKVKERLIWRGTCTFGPWEVVTTVTLTREIASAAELGTYLKELIAPLIPIATKVLLAATL